jgi:signal transduction histidine kinase
VKRALNLVGKRPVATVALTRPIGLVAYFAGAVVVSVGLALVAPYVPSFVIGIVVAAYLSVIALFLCRNRRRMFTYARWRDVMPCLLSVQDRNLRIIDSNDRFRSSFGDRDGERCYNVYKNRDSPCPECPVLRTFHDGQVHTSEETVLDRAGEIEHVVVTSAPLLDDKGQVSAVVEMSTSITDLKMLQDELERTHRDYKRLFDQVPCYISVINRDLQVVQSNSLYRRDFDVAGGDFCYEICKQRHSQCPDCLVKETFADGQMHMREEKLTTRDDRHLDAVLYTMPVRDSSGETTAVVEMFTDITEVKRLQKQLTLMGRAVAGMAHRIKNILMGLEGGIFVVNTGIEDDDRAQIAEGWEMVQRNVGRVSNLVKDLLYCSKERTPKFEDDVCLQDIIHDVRELYSQRVADEAIKLELELDDIPHRGRFDPDGIHSLLCNLVGNAIDGCRFDLDETKTSHTIRLRCQRNGLGATVLEVEDDGVGIPEEMTEKVFEDFFSTKGTEGTGVGLLVVQKVAQEHGGSVTFNSKPGKGARFQVTIPPVGPS